MIKKIAWGTSKLLEMYLRQTKSNPFSYCIDDFTKRDMFCGLQVKRSTTLSNEKKGEFLMVIFAVSNEALQEISSSLRSSGLSYGKDFIFYSDFFRPNFEKKTEKLLGIKLNNDLYRYALSFTLNSRTSIHTTILGTWLFLELVKKVDSLHGQIAEVGSFQGGNVLCALNFMAAAGLHPKKYYAFDSFEGFPELSEFDPKSFRRGDHSIKVIPQEIMDKFVIFPNAKIVKGFIPKTFSHIGNNERFALVFYDCDLYEPALATYKYFWDKIVPGGYMVIHDYETQTGGFTGVKKASEEFFGPLGVVPTSFFENTMAVIKKQ
ncbi:MAG: TylF/MycF/NovP-related O-methyltransferase [Patescibacteria group bacterium]